MNIFSFPYKSTNQHTYARKRYDEMILLNVMQAKLYDAEKIIVLFGLQIMVR